ncbi:MAG: sulfatase-like hydrolase/transferase [Prosthecobacter sp.]|jgi:iduronate 2-sulfatase|uniref:sulfatase-like hydrolase/transferase n=1 Tax=Prosthecobacter sp. TaxID=1965333 RepID=UPI001A0A49D4|nr:sulfatase-like hydrolase/transferase [Prosthecobacter sp.]MBE2285724.1 sulfatase-like hydrolase/transferase [Prosthecobacter sp.]
MFRVVFLLSVFCSSLCAASKPNVLLICVDDLKPVLGCYGDKIVKSPHIDRLAQRGVLFEKAFCNQAVCSPSRNALLTGLRSQTLGIYDLATNFRKSVPDAVTLPQHFKMNGYRVEGLGKIFHVGHGNVNDEASWSVPHFSPKTISYVLKENNPPESTREQALFENKKEAWKLPRGAPTEAADVPDNKYGDGMIADEAIKRLEAAKAKPDEPFFLAVGFLKPHLPFVAPKKYWDLYDPSVFKLPELQTPPEGAPEFAPSSWGELRQYKDMPEKGPVTTEQAIHLIHGYYAATSYMDTQLGKVLDALDANGFAENTIIVLWGDHGWHLGDHGMWCKHTNYEQAARIPVIVAAPGIKGGQNTQALIESCDIYPTLAELTALPAPKQGDGRSFASVLKDPSSSVRDHAIHVYPRGQGLIGRAVRTQRHRLVEWKKPGEPAGSAILELYDYEADPAETKNLAASQPEVVAELRKLLATHPEAKPQISNKPEPKKAEAKKPAQDRGKMFDQRDKNKDGQLTKEEFLLNQPDPDEAPKRFPKFDADNNGTLSREEFIKGGKK